MGKEIKVIWCSVELPVYPHFCLLLLLLDLYVQKAMHRR